jgi:hypothetical protein
MRSRACVLVISVATGVAAIACGPARQQPAETRQAVSESAHQRLGQIDEYEVGAATYERFRRYEWPFFTILHMDVRSGPVEKAEAVVVLGVAGGEATSPGGAESLVDAVLGQSDDRGLCIVRGWLDGQRHVAALPMECPVEVRDELDGILHDFDDLTGGEAIWVLRFEQGLLRSKQRL